MIKGFLVARKKAGKRREYRRKERSESILRGFVSSRGLPGFGL